MTFLTSAARESEILLFSIINSDAARQALDGAVIPPAKGVMISSASYDALNVRAKDGFNLRSSCGWKCMEG